MNAFERWNSVGAILLRNSHCTQEQIQQALAQQQVDHKPLGEILTNLGFVERSEVEEALAKQKELRPSETSADDALAKTLNLAKQRQKTTTMTLQAISDDDLA